jgi:hypothetical protein
VAHLCLLPSPNVTASLHSDRRCRNDLSARKAAAPVQTVAFHAKRQSSESPGCQAYRETIGADPSPCTATDRGSGGLAASTGRDHARDASHARGRWFETSRAIHKFRPTTERLGAGLRGLVCLHEDRVGVIQISGDRDHAGQRGAGGPRLADGRVMSAAGHVGIEDDDIGAGAEPAR